MLEASGLPRAYSFNVFCQYKFWDQNEAVTVPSCTTDSFCSQDSPPPNLVHHFNYSKIFDVKVTEEFIAAIEGGFLAVDIWGHHHGGFMAESANQSGWSGEETFEGVYFFCSVLQKINTNTLSHWKNAGMM